jgi:hypothetical protein
VNVSDLTAANLGRSTNCVRDEPARFERKLLELLVGVVELANRSGV